MNDLAMDSKVEGFGAEWHAVNLDKMGPRLHLTSFQKENGITGFINHSYLVKSTTFVLMLPNL